MEMYRRNVALMSGYKLQTTNNVGERVSHLNNQIKQYEHTYPDFVPDYLQHKAQRTHTGKEDRPSLFRFIWGVLKKNKCHLYRLNGIDDHLHILTHLHPSVALADLVKDIKLAGTNHIKNANLFKEFNGWQDGYGAFTYSIDAKNTLIEYTKNQEEHHRKTTFREEYIALLKEHQIEFDEKYLL